MLVSAADGREVGTMLSAAVGRTLLSKGFDSLVWGLLPTESTAVEPIGRTVVPDKPPESVWLVSLLGKCSGSSV